MQAYIIIATQQMRSVFAHLYNVPLNAFSRKYGNERHTLLMNLHSNVIYNWEMKLSRRGGVGHTHDGND
jgi:hypothetical protein